jgi:hypothetical protein
MKKTTRNLMLQQVIGGSASVALDSLTQSNFSLRWSASAVVIGY